jgi:hypothetical protein
MLLEENDLLVMVLYHPQGLFKHVKNGLLQNEAFSSANILLIL